VKPARFLASLTGVAVLISMAGCGITASSRSEGYADFDPPYFHGMKRDTGISLGPSVLRFAAKHVDEDPEAEALLRAIDGVRVSIYPLTGELDRENLIRSLNDTAADLAADDWQTIVHVQEEEKTVFVLLKTNDSGIKGVTLLTADTGEFVFVNVMGELSAKALARIANEVPGGDTLSFVTAQIE